MSAEPKIKALTPWFGGKRTLAPRIAELLGQHRCYWDIFCGSMAVLLSKAPAAMETVNDLHGDMVNLARVIQSPTWGPKLYRALRRVFMSEPQFTECDARLRAAPTYEPGELGEEALARAFDYFVVSWMGRNGTAGTPINCKGSYCVRYTSNGGHAGKRWASAVRSIPEWRARLAHVTILRRDAFDLLARIEDRENTVIYADPPYVVKGAKYLHDFEPLDHARLAESLRRFCRTRVVVSYYECPEVRELYRGWSFEEIDVSKAMCASGSRGKNDVRATELLIHNVQSGLFAAL